MWRANRENMHKSIDRLTIYAILNNKIIIEGNVICILKHHHHHQHMIDGVSACLPHNRLDRLFVLCNTWCSLRTAHSILMRDSAMMTKIRCDDPGWAESEASINFPGNTNRYIIYRDCSCASNNVDTCLVLIYSIICSIAFTKPMQQVMMMCEVRSDQVVDGEKNS